jgi:hypothetical protein
VTSATRNFQHTRWSAHDGPNGPAGAVRYTAQLSLFGGFVDVRGKVTCVEVSGNVAFVAARLSEPRASGATHITLIVRDNGNPVNGISLDEVYVTFVSTPPSEPLCAPVGGARVIGEQHGNAIVRDDA